MLNKLYNRNYTERKAKQWKIVELVSGLFTKFWPTANLLSVRVRTFHLSLSYVENYRNFLAFRFRKHNITKKNHEYIHFIVASLSRSLSLYFFGLAIYFCRLYIFCESRSFMTSSCIKFCNLEAITQCCTAGIEFFCRIDLGVQGESLFKFNWNNSKIRTFTRYVNPNNVINFSHPSTFYLHD